MNPFAFEIRCIQFNLEAIEPIYLSRFKGSAFHGGLGHALKTFSKTWFDYFYQTQNQHGSQLPNPFVLLPPLDNQLSYQAGEQFQCRISLFGDASEHYSIVQAAIEYLGQELGLGNNRGKFKVINIKESNFTNTSSITDSLTLNCITRLRLKTDNQLLKETPQFSLFIKRLLGRLKTLQLSFSDSPVDEYQYRQLLDQATDVTLLSSTIQWKEWDRYSGRQKKWMKFGGLLGDMTYQGNLQPFIPVLKMGELCHIGGKSSFGLGKYSIGYGDLHENS